jgi:hypothetical protein
VERMEKAAKHESIYKADSANPEFLFVLSKIVMALQEAMHNDKLPDLTPEQMSDWFKSIEPEHIHCVIKALQEGSEEHRLLMAGWAKIAKRAPCDDDKGRPSGTSQKDKDRKPN